MSTISRLYYLYFGFSALGLASIVFNIFCPQLIKSYNSASAYLSDQIGLMSGSQVLQIANSLLIGSLKRVASQVKLADRVAAEYAERAMHQVPPGGV